MDAQDGLQTLFERMDGCMGNSPIDSKRGFAQVCWSTAHKALRTDRSAKTFSRSRVAVIAEG